MGTKLVPVYEHYAIVNGKDFFEQTFLQDVLVGYTSEKEEEEPCSTEIDRNSTRIIWKVYATRVYKESPDEAEIAHIEAPCEQAAAFIYQRAYLNPNEPYPFAIVTEDPPGYFPGLSKQAVRILCPYIDFYAARWINEGAVDYEIRNS